MSDGRTQRQVRAAFPVDVQPVRVGNHGDSLALNPQKPQETCVLSGLVNRATPSRYPHLPASNGPGRRRPGPHSLLRHFGGYGDDDVSRHHRVPRQTVGRGAPPFHRWHADASVSRYSEVGVVEETGRGVSSVAGGDVVWGIWGHRSHAVLAEAVLLGHLMPDSVDPIVGTFDRVGAVALNAVLDSGARVGEIVAVFGQGVIGLLATQLLNSMGCRVIAIDAMPNRLALAARFGAQSLDPRDGDLALAVAQRFPSGVDRGIELSGSYAALHQATRLAGPGGTVIAASPVKDEYKTKAAK